VLPQLNENSNVMIQKKEIDLRTSHVPNSNFLLDSRKFGNHPQLYRNTRDLCHNSHMLNSKDQLHNRRRQPSSCQLDVNRDHISDDTHPSFTYLRCTLTTAREGSQQLQ
jgi:hypothetical protein